MTDYETLIQCLETVRYLRYTNDTKLAEEMYQDCVSNLQDLITEMTRTEHISQKLAQSCQTDLIGTV